MNRDTIIRLARQAGFVVDELSQQHQPNCIFHTHHMVDGLLERFAALVAAQERERYEAHRLQQEAWNIDSKYAGLLALTLECMILDPRRWHDDAVKVLDDYRSEWNKLNPSPSPFGKD